MGGADSKKRLSFLQEWMYRCITDPRGVVAGARQNDGVNPIPGIIRSTEKLGATDRLAIYHNAYHLRLMQVLEAEYPALKLALGEKLFSGFALFYIQRNPPCSFTLYELSAMLPEFLSGSVPQENEDEGWPDFIISLVRLERMFQEVYRGPGTEGKPVIQANAVPRNWKQVIFQAAPGLRLMESNFPVHEFLVAARSKNPLPIPEAQETQLAVYRKNYQVKIQAVSKKQYASLEHILAGQNAGKAGVKKDELTKWISEGLVTGML